MKESINIKITLNKESLGIQAAHQFAEIANKHLSQNSVFNVALSGGSTPELLYENLVQYYQTGIEWQNVRFFWSDERYVALDHPDSNAGMANRKLLTPLGIQSNMVYYPPTGNKNPEQAAKDYAKTIRNNITTVNVIPEFDLILLGMGDDGHTASLFPGTTALAETQELVKANWVPKFENWRLTFTFPLINSAKNIIFLISGAEKAVVIKDIFEHKGQYPAAQIKPVKGNLIWLLDDNAAKLLPQSILHQQVIK